jgi:hypothetical protein
MNKTCTKCSGSFPATDEYFYWINKEHTRLRGECKRCTQEMKMGKPSSYVPVKNPQKRGRKPKLYKPVFKDGRLVTKTCTHCQTPKSINEFPPNRRMSDGRDSWCRECHSEANRQNTHNNAFLKEVKRKFRSLVKQRRLNGESDEQIKTHYTRLWQKQGVKKEHILEALEILDLTS